MLNKTNIKTHLKATGRTNPLKIKPLSDSQSLRESLLEEKGLICLQKDIKEVGSLATYEREF